MGRARPFFLHRKSGAPYGQAGNRDKSSASLTASTDVTPTPSPQDKTPRTGSVPGAPPPTPSHFPPSPHETVVARRPRPWVHVLHLQGRGRSLEPHSTPPPGRSPTPDSREPANPAPSRYRSDSSLRMGAPSTTTGHRSVTIRATPRPFPPLASVGSRITPYALRLTHHAFRITDYDLPMPSNLWVPLPPRGLP